jgi:hypothetical protein
VLSTTADAASVTVLATRRSTSSKAANREAISAVHMFQTAAVAGPSRDTCCGLATNDDTDVQLSCGAGAGAGAV